MRTPWRKGGSGSAPVITGSYTLAAPAYTTVGIFRKSDPEPKTLLRTIWFNEYQSAGLHYVYWDGLDDLGNDIIATNDYEAKVLTHNMAATWETLGNTSQFNHGATVFNSYSWFVNAAISGDNVYIGESFNEGGARAGFKLLTSDILADTQTCYDVLPYATDPNRGNPNDTDLSTEYVCTNGTVTFWGGNDPYAAYSPNTLGQSWVFGTYVSNDTNYPFSSGVSEKCGLGKTYPNAIDVVLNDPTNEITGMCCNASYLWVARGTTGNIYCYDATTGALLSTSSGFTNPRKLAYDSSNGGRVWFLQGVNQMVKGTIGALGALSSGSLLIADFPTDKQTLAIDNATNTLAVICAGSNQQVWFWNISAGTPSTNHFAELGQVGGYAVDSTAANDRFSFTDNSTGQIKGLNQCYIAYDSSSRLYVGDVGSVRMQVFDSSLTFLKTVQMFGALYGVSIDLNDANRGFATAIEFDMTTQQMTANWTAQIPAGFFSQGYGLFKWCSTLSNGRTYATLEEQGVAPADTYVYELESTGTLRDTGVTINEPGLYFGNYLDKDFTIWNIFSASYAVGQQPIIRKKEITGFTGGGDPIYAASWTTVCTLQPITADDCLIDAGNTSFIGITDSGIVVLKNKEITTTSLWHLQGYDVNTGNLVWSTYRPDSRAGDFAGFLGYSGAFPDPRYFERGNIVNTNTFNDIQVVEDLVILIYNGENWKAKQTNYFNMYHTIGLPILQFGTDRVTSEAIEVCGEESSGNGFSMRMSKVDNTTYNVVNGDESVHSALHHWTVTGIDTIDILTVQIAPPTYPPTVGEDQLGSVTFNSILTTTGNITLSNPTTSTWNAQSGIQSYDSYDPDISLELDAGSNIGANRYVDLDITPVYDPALTQWEVFGDINWCDYYGPQDGSYEAGGIIEVLDSGGLVITSLGLGENASDVYLLDANVTDNIITTTDSDIIVNTLGKWNTFSIVVDATDCTITYGQETPVVSSIVDPSAVWNEPTTIRLRVKESGATFHYGTRTLAVKGLRYLETL